MTEVSGKTCLVTGGAMGMGRLLAETLAREGARLALWDKNEAALAEAKEAVEALGAKVRTDVVDITDRALVYETAEKVTDDVGIVDVLVNNAGVIRGGMFLDVTDEDHQLTMDVNVNSYFWVTRAFLPAMIERDQGHVVNVASAAGLAGVAGTSSYCASKFAVVGWTESLRAEMYKLEKHGVKFTTICPSFVSTGMFEGVVQPGEEPMLTPEFMVDKIYQAIKKDAISVKEPFGVKLLPLIKAIGNPKVLMWFAGRSGLHDVMDHWKGRPDIS